MLVGISAGILTADASVTSRRTAVQRGPTWSNVVQRGLMLNAWDPSDCSREHSSI